MMNNGMEFFYTLNSYFIIQFTFMSSSIKILNSKSQIPKNFCHLYFYLTICPVCKKHDINFGF